MQSAVRGSELMTMLRWHIGVETDFKVNPGKLGKYFQKYLEPELWELLLKTFSDADHENTWDTLFATGDLFRKTAIPIAGHYGFEYPINDDRKVTAYLEHIRTLPNDAQEIYKS